jgi:O-antigen ligase
MSFKRCVQEVQAVIMALVVLSEPSWRSAIAHILRRITFIYIPFSVLLIKYFPYYGVTYDRWSGDQSWIGVTQQKNGLGALCLISAFYLIWSMVKRRQAHQAPAWKYQPHSEIFLLAITLWLMGGPYGNPFYSATSTYSLAIGLLVYLGLNYLKKSGRRLPVGVLMAAVIGITVFGIVEVYGGGSGLSFFASKAGRDSTITGRAGVWAALLSVVMQRPILGGGFGAFWTPITREAFNISGAHSGYLDILIALGFVGIFLFTLFFLSSCRKADEQLIYDFDMGSLWICYLIMMLIHNITESSMGSFTNSFSALILFFTVASSKVVSMANSTA